MTTSRRYDRNWAIVRLRNRGHTWSDVSERSGLTVRHCQRIYREHSDQLEEEARRAEADAPPPEKLSDAEALERGRALVNSLQRQFETVIRIAGSYEKLPSEELLIALADRVVPSNVEELLRILDTLGFDNPG